ncbi:MAG: hypothetical protein ACRDEA_08965, partial [Microcystaceae cyanobacterium]
MGAAIPVVGAVTGTIGTLAGISQQNKAASAQDAANAAQQEASLQNMQMRLQELERQKMFTQFSSQIDEAARRQERAFQIQDNKLQQKQYEIQNTLQNFNFDAQRQGLEQQKIAQNTQLDEAGLQNLASSQNDLFGIDQQYGGAIVNANQQYAGAEAQGGQEAQQVAYGLQDSAMSQEQAIRQMAAQRAGLIGQGETGMASRSDQAQLSGGAANLVNQGNTQNKRALSALDMINMNANMAGNYRDFATNSAALNRGQQVNQSQQQFLANDRQMQTQKLQTAMQYGQDVLGLSLDQMLQNNQIREGMQSLGLLDQAQTNRYDLENMQSKLNQQFYDTQATANRASVQIAGGSELAALQAQRSSIQRPGALSILGSLAQGGQSIYNTLNSGRSSSYQPTGYTPPA